MAKPAHLAGVSLASVIHAPDARPRTSTLTQSHKGNTLRMPNYRYTEYGPDGANGVEFYNHASDPAEMRNLAGRKEYEELRRKLSAQLRERVKKASELSPETVVTQNVKKSKGGTKK